EVSDWPTLAEAAVSEIATKLEKLEPNDEEGLNALLNDCDNKISLIDHRSCIFYAYTLKLSRRYKEGSFF
ncbi:MAG: hypothetical protein ACEROO_12855, partial [Candidatus Bathyarchaeota archaeon]